VRREARLDFSDALADCLDAGTVQLLVLPLRKDQRRLPVIVALEKNEDAAAASTSMGGEVMTGSKPARRRSREKRPSAPTVSGVRISCAPSGAR
jgi:hypothetical protein